jgi:hypothetical protein
LCVAKAVPAANAGSTNSVNVAVAVFPSPSVTVNVTVNGDPVVAVGVQLIDDEFELLHPVGRFVHAYVKLPDPPEAPLVEIVVN